MSDSMHTAQLRFDSLEAEPPMTNRERTRKEEQLDDYRCDLVDLESDMETLKANIRQLEEELEEGREL